MNKTLISIIVPIYNVEAYLEKCIISLVNQTYKNIEIILVNDGSLDNSYLICENWIKKDKRIKYIKKKNGGLSDARNAGLDIANGDYILFVDSDDYIDTTTVELLVNKKNEFDLLIYNFSEVTEDGQVTSKSSFKEKDYFFKNEKDKFKYITNNLLTGINGWEAWNKLYNAHIIRKYNMRYYDNKEIFAEDLEFNIRYISFCENIRVIDDALYFYLLRNNSIMGQEAYKNKLPNMNCLSKQIYSFAKENKFNHYLNNFYLLHFGILRSALQRIYHKSPESIKSYINEVIPDRHYSRNINKIIFRPFRIYKTYGKKGLALGLLTVFKNYSLIYKVKDLLKYINYIQFKFKLLFVRDKIFLIGTEDFGNLGDHHIAKSEIDYLIKHFPNKKIIEITATKFYKIEKYLNKLISDEDIYITGGGNMGTLYPTADYIKQKLIQTFVNNRIVIFPVTIHYEENQELYLSNAKEFINHHKNLILTVREEKSYDFAKKHFTCKILLVPDIVLYSQYNFDIKRSNDILFCVRSDKEKVLSIESQNEIEYLFNKKGYSVLYTDTQLKNNIDVKDRDKYLFEKLGEFATSKLVVTDRLHGMIFAAITKTPCIVFDNFNNKTSGVYDWLKDLSYVELLKESSLVSDVADKLLLTYPTEADLDILRELKVKLDIIERN